MTELQSHTALLRAPRQLDIVARPKPKAELNEILVRTAATAVCHTDLEIYTGNHPGVNYPVVMGHEATGVVESVGNNVSALEPGQHIIINPIIACGTCDSCARDDEHLCRNAGLFGREVEGSLSEFVRLDAKYAHVLPASMSLSEATIIETLATVRHAQQRAGLLPNESVVILGQGTTGLLHTQLASLAGADPVIGVSRSQWKLDLATNMGANHAIEADVEDAVDEVLRLTHGLGSDLVIDTSGAGKALKSGIDMLRPGGRFCAFSVSQKLVRNFSTFPLYYKEVNIIGSRALTAADMEPAIDLVATGKIKVSDLITETYPLDRVSEAFERYEQNPERILRILIESRK